MLKIDEFRAALSGHSPQEIPDSEGMKRAAVAAILRSAGQGPELLFIHRAEDPRDPWSGHMAFPGGKVDDADADPRAAALRETREEVGLDLKADAQELGRLSDVRAVGRGRPLSMVISPYVFELQTTPQLRTNHEVETAVWVPVDFLADHANRETMPYRRYGLSLELPCYRYDGHLIWGLTLGMADDLLRLATP